MDETLRGDLGVRFPVAPAGLTPVEIATVMTSMNNIYEVLYSWSNPKYGHEAFPGNLGNRRRTYLEKADQLQVQGMRYGSPLELIYRLDGSEIIQGSIIVTTVAIAVKHCFNAISSAFEAAEDGASAVAACREEFENLRRFFGGDDETGRPPTTSLQRSVDTSRTAAPSTGASIAPDAKDPRRSLIESKGTLYRDADVDRLLDLIVRECRRILEICGYPRFDI